MSEQERNHSSSERYFPDVPAVVDDKPTEMQHDLAWLTKINHGCHFTHLTPKKVRKVLKVLADGLTPSEAADTIGATRQTIYHWRNRYPAFDELYKNAVESGTDQLEAVARKRAMEKSDLLMMFLLKSRDPERFRENTSVQISNNISLYDVLLKGLEQPSPATTIEHKSEDK